SGVSGSTPSDRSLAGQSVALAAFHSPTRVAPSRIATSGTSLVRRPAPRHGIPASASARRVRTTPSGPKSYTWLLASPATPTLSGGRYASAASPGDIGSPPPGFGAGPRPATPIGPPRVSTSQRTAPTSGATRSATARPPSA